MFKRLRNDFQLSIIALMGIIGVLGISPYAIYRLLHGNYLVGIADCIIVFSTIAAVIYAWRTGDTEKPGLYLCAVFSVGATLIAINLGVNGLFWIYPLILFNFFMVSPGKAIVASLLVLTSLVAHSIWVPGSVFDSHYQMVSFLVTNAMAGVLTFIFAYRTRTQRDQLQVLAIHDPLTGARNRRAMNEELKIAVSSQRRHGRQYGVLVLDLDHFKQINDQHGHHTGDLVLVEFVELIKNHSRKEDRLFRFGGEEFLLLLPDTDPQGLKTAADHLRECISTHLRSPGGMVTVSIGGAMLRRNETWSHWLQRADQCLYQAKSSGRNRCIIDSSQEALNAVAAGK
ncbi:GGDEF domain-containing protein [Pseudomonas sp. GOM6]|uniref:GGDEF domain-containing protein n=1 Tax=Pseudomonas sp. GOM6 TaxID=3036944 RepID=UPI0024093B96|nr:GGDEF domain-containing protein [Pseudomonas sp. GOM6]MDG1581700.1 GGDEF domain-containing protein [Pseudomonas sp. GOM6]